MRACTRAHEAKANPQSTRWHPNGSREASSPFSTLMMTEVDAPILGSHQAEGDKNSSSAIDLIPLHLGAIAVEDATCSSDSSVQQQQQTSGGPCSSRSMGCPLLYLPPARATILGIQGERPCRSANSTCRSKHAHHFCMYTANSPLNTQAAPQRVCSGQRPVSGCQHLGLPLGI